MKKLKWDWKLGILNIFEIIKKYNSKFTTKWMKLKFDK